ncbi:GNAT family N-acetyltransferase [Streptomyces sp. M19]
MYADAYGVAPSEEKTAAFRRRAEKQFSRPGFLLVTARAGGHLVGFVFGYALPAGDTHWWGGVRPEPTAEFLEETGARTWVVSEIEVRRARQGKGVGERCMTRRSAHGAKTERRWRRAPMLQYSLCMKHGAGRESVGFRGRW